MKLLLAMLALAAVAAVVQRYRQRAMRGRAAELRALAAEMNCAFEPGTDHLHRQRFAQFDAFQNRVRGTALHTLRATIEGPRGPMQLVAGDFRYVARSGQGGDRIALFSYLILHPIGSTLDLTLRPRGVTGRVLGRLLGDAQPGGDGEAADLAGDELRRHYRVEADGGASATSPLRPAEVQLILDERPPALQIAGDALCVHGSDDWAPEEFARYLAFATRLAAALPA